MTDEIIDPDKDGFYYSTNENPTNCSYQIGTSYNTCYKFKTKWNYYLWYYHNAPHANADYFVEKPVAKYSDGKVTLRKNNTGRVSALMRITLKKSTLSDLPTMLIAIRLSPSIIR